MSDTSAQAYANYRAEEDRRQGEANKSNYSIPMPSPTPTYTPHTPNISASTSLHSIVGPLFNTYPSMYRIRRPMGAVPYALAGAIVGMFVGWLATIQLHIRAGSGFSSAYALCFIVSFAGLFYGTRQFFRHKWIKATLALVVSYVATQVILPGFYLPGILKAML